MNQSPRFPALNCEYPSQFSRASLWTSLQRSIDKRIESKIIIAKDRLRKTLIRRVAYLPRVLAPSLVYLPEGTLAYEFNHVVVFDAHCWIRSV